MLVSGIQQSDSVIHIHVSILFQILFPFRLLQSIEQSLVLYSRSLLVICFIYGSGYLWIPNSQFIPHPLLSPLVTVSFFSMSMSLFLFYKFICIIFLDSTYKWYHMIFVFLCLTISHNMIISRSIHVAAKGIVSFFFYG